MSIFKTKYLNTMNYINKNILKSAAFMFLFVSLAASNAIAVAFFTFDDFNSQGGTLSYDGNGGSLQGRNIIFDDVTSDVNGESYSINAVLSFDTGDYLDNVSGNWAFDAGGWFNMTGTVYNSSGNEIISNQTLLSGSFEETSIFSGTSGLFSAFQAIGSDTTIVNDVLLGLLGFDQQLFSLSAAISSLTPDTIELGASGSGSINVTVSNSDLTLRATGVSVPSTGSTLAMLGLGLMSLNVIARRKK